uniref:C2H2-type domain-containing protein n=1 Tax=Neogobius melanostomus TaxID=47308 RepID=A0A8C6S9S9_9GOBI
MIRATGSGSQRERVTRWSNLYFNGDERKYGLWEFKFLRYLRLLGLKGAILGESDNDQERNKEAYAELIQVLDDKSLSLVWREAADDGRKALKILREHYTGETRGVQTPSLSPGPPAQKQEIPETPEIKEDVVEVIIKEEEEQLPVSVPESSAVCVKREDSDTDNDDDCELFRCSSAKSTALFPKNQSAPEPSASVNDEELSGAAPSALGKKHQCLVCKKRFVTKQVLQDHVRVHTGERPYCCSVCGKTFTQRSNLSTHERVHSGAEGKKHQCSVCKRRFSQKHVLRKHVRVHTGERPYSCSVCGTTFAQKINLSKHERSHSVERPYSCPVCNKHSPKRVI